MQLLPATDCDSATEDSPGYLAAIKKSLEDTPPIQAQDQTAPLPATDAMATDPNEITPRPLNLDDMIADMTEKKAFEVPRLNVPNDDT